MTLPPAASFDLPPEMSTLAPRVDWLYNFIWWFSAISFVVITALVIIFVIKYRRRPGHKAEPTGHNTILELTWTFLPLILLVFLFHKGFEQYMAGIVAPPNAIEIHVRGQQWSWEFQYDNGAKETGNLWVPVHTPVKLVMSSADVLHAFFVPAFRIKRDVIPGQYSSFWFNATHTGVTQAYCNVYCGAPVGVKGNAGHSSMLAKVHVVSMKEYKAHIASLGGPPSKCKGIPNPMVCWGKELYETKGCTACHHVDGVTTLPCPQLKGIWGTNVSLEGGGSATVDENYIRESVLQPQAKIVKGYNTVKMPPFGLNDKEVDAIVAYIKSLGQ